MAADLVDPGGRQGDVALQESARQLNSIFDHSPVGIALVAPDNRFLEVNAALCRFLGYAEEELRGLSFVAFTHPDDRERDAEQVRRLGLGDIDHYETDKRYVKKDGSVVWGHVAVALVRDANGRPEYFLPTVQDITQRKQAEESLRESEERYRTAFLTSPDSVNVNRIEDGLYVDVNEGFVVLTGWTRDEALGKTSADLGIWVDPADRERLVAALDRDGRCQNLEATFRNKDGTTRKGLMSARVIMSGGVPCVLSVTRDISELRRAEEERSQLEHQLLQAQKLESLGVLAGGIAHDFNNILTSVLGHAELAVEELPAESPARHSLGEISAAARRAAELCRQMLAYSGHASLALERIDLGALIGEMRPMLRASVAKNAVLEVHREKDVPAIQADPSQIRQVVTNLVLNASEAIGERNGVISVSVGVVRCGAGYLQTTEVAGELREGLYVRMDVSDNGCGMPPDVRRRIFEPFFSTKFSGRGLGLAALLGIVRSQHGGVKVESEPGEGSRFTVLFPAIESADSQAGVPDAASKAWRGAGTVLLADDEQSLRTLGAKMLSRLGFDVVTAGDGREAVEIFRQRRGEIRLVILDLTMPHLDGAQAFAELRKLDADVPIVLASGYGREDVAARLPGEALGVLQKPYSLAKIEELLAGLGLTGGTKR